MVLTAETGMSLGGKQEGSEAEVFYTLVQRETERERGRARKGRDGRRGGQKTEEKRRERERGEERRSGDT